MRDPVLRTQLHRPAVRTGTVPRDRLERLLEPPCRLAVVSAPPGFGKTTLMASWARAATDAGRPVAWVSLDAAQAPRESFWTYVVTALEGVVPGSAAGALAVLKGPDPVGVRCAHPRPQRAGRPAGRARPGARRLPPRRRPGLAADVAFRAGTSLRRCAWWSARAPTPPCPSRGLRARGELVEVRAADLRFTAAGGGRPTSTTSTGLALSPDDVSALERAPRAGRRHCSWRRCRSRGARTAAVHRGFAGDDRFVVDYLVEEVLDRQPEGVRRFLLDTSVLDRLSGPLCDAVTGGRAAGQRWSRWSGRTCSSSRSTGPPLVPVPPPVRRRAARSPRRGTARRRAHGLHRRAGDW